MVIVTLPVSAAACINLSVGSGCVVRIWCEHPVAPFALLNMEGEIQPIELALGGPEANPNIDVVDPGAELTTPLLEGVRDEARDCSRGRWRNALAKVASKLCGGTFAQFEAYECAKDTIEQLEDSGDDIPLDDVTEYAKKRRNRGRFARWLARKAQCEFGIIPETAANYAVAYRYIRDSAREWHVRETDIASMMDEAMAAFFTVPMSHIIAKQSRVVGQQHERAKLARQTHVLVVKKVLGCIPWIVKRKLPVPAK